MKTLPSGRRAGGALLLAVISFLFMAGIGTALFSLAMSSRRTTRAASNADAAFHVAEAGVDDAINKMRAYQADPDNQEADFAAVGVMLKLDNGGVGNKLEGDLNGGAYEVTIEPAYDGLGEYKITSIGLHNGEKRGIETWITAEGESGGIKFGLFGDAYLNAAGTPNTDGYDSSKGSYASQAKTAVGKVKVANMSGHIGSNGAVSVSGNAMIYGNATPGPNNTVTGKGKIYGTKTPAKTSTPLPDPDFSVPPKAKALKTLPATLAGGAYTIASIKGSGKTTLTISGDVALYVNGNFDFSGQSKIVINAGAKLTVYQNAPKGTFKINGGNTTNSSQLPSAFTYYSNAASGTLNGNADFFGTLYAPKTALKISGNSGIYGSTVGKSVDLSGTAFFHFDEALGGMSSGTVAFNVKSYHQFVP